MLKTLKLFYFLLLLLPPQVSALEYKIQDSKILGLWSLALGMTSNPIGSELMAKQFLEDKQVGLKEKEALRQCAEVLNDYINQGFTFQNQVKGRNEQGWDHKKHFAFHAAMAANLKDFEIRTRDVIPYAQHQKLFNALSVIEPAYQKLIWNPSLPALKN